jgi:purine nucleoside permease
MKPLRLVALLLAAVLAACASGPQPESPAPVPVKVMVITLFGPEARPWSEHLALTKDVPVAGLSPQYPAIRCTAEGVCLLTTGMGHANAAASTVAMALSPALDLSHAYFIVTGIAGIDPNQGTIGAATWTRWLVDFGLAHEIDAREMPPGWSAGYFGIHAKDPATKPALNYGTEVFRLDERLLQKALALSRGAELADNPQAQAYRQLYPQEAARRGPSVLQCDTLAGDTYWHGEKLGEWAARWTKVLTDGAGTYCTTQQEDNATYEALRRGAAAGRLDIRRVAVLRTASNFDRPHPGQTPYESLNTPSGGFAAATANLYNAGWPLVRDIVAHWPQWREGVPD